MIPVPEHISTLRAYKAGRSAEEVERELGIHNVIKLASNENPFGSSPKGIDAIRRVAGDLARYPTLADSLRSALADRHVITQSNVICGSGSESIIEIALSSFLGPEDEIVTSAGTFIGFQVLAHRFGVKTHYVAHDRYRYDTEAMLKAITPKTRIVYIANPNNPTGTFVSSADLERFIAKIPDSVLVILDEAYFEYAVANADYPDSMRWRWDNVLTCRTFSKAHGLAGVRIGYGMAHSDIIGTMMKVKLPFEPTTPSAAAALAALEDADFLAKTVEQNRSSLRYFHEEFERLGLDYVPSLANFVMIDLSTAETVERINEGLLSRGVITRPLEAFGLPHCLRISTGLDEQNRRCVTAIEEILDEEQG